MFSVIPVLYEYVRRRVEPTTEEKMDHSDDDKFGCRSVRLHCCLLALSEYEVFVCPILEYEVDCDEVY